MQNITTPQCDHCPKKVVQNSRTNHTAVKPSPPPSPREYILIDMSGEVCLRIKATFILMRHTTKIRNVTLISLPIEKAYGMCFYHAASLKFEVAGGFIELIFRKNKKDGSFYLGYMTLLYTKDGIYLGIIKSLTTFVTPLGHYFTSKEVNLELTPTVSVVFRDVKIQAFAMERGNFRRGDTSVFVTYENESVRLGFGKELILKYKPKYFEHLEYLDSLIRHWSVAILVPSIHTVVFLVALPLNIMAIIMFLVKMKVRKPAVVYMLNLASADLLLISILPFYIVYRFSEYNWSFGEGMCRFVTAAFYCNMYCSVLLMTSISVDRFLAIVYPVRSLPWRTVTRAWLVCGVIWVISLVSTVPLLIREQTVFERMLGVTMCHDVQHFGAFFVFGITYFSTVFSLFNFLPLFVTTFCYIGIIRSLSRSKFDRTHKRSRAIRLTVVVLSVFVFCFGPTNVIYLIHFVNDNQSLYIPYILSSSISSINCCLDPLIYYFASSQCQRYVHSLLHLKKHHRPPVKKKENPATKRAATREDAF